MCRRCCVTSGSPRLPGTSDPRPTTSSAGSKTTKTPPRAAQGSGVVLRDCRSGRAFRGAAVTVTTELHRVATHGRRVVEVRPLLVRSVPPRAGATVDEIVELTRQRIGDSKKYRLVRERAVRGLLGGWRRSGVLTGRNVGRQHVPMPPAIWGPRTSGWRMPPVRAASFR